MVVLLYGCAIYPRSGPAALIDTWTNSLGTVWMLCADGTFSVDLNHDGKRDAWGTYGVKADTIRIHGTGGTIPSDCKGDGTYHFDRAAADALHFALIKDSCKLRVKNVMLDWHRK